MGARHPAGPLRRLASLLIRGPDARFVLADLDDALERDLARGIPPGRARRRYARNLAASALAVARSRLRPAALPFSLLDVKLGARMLLKQPGITAVAVFALGVGIPVGMAPWQFADAIESDLPVDRGDRIKRLRYWNVSASRPDSTTFHDYERWREELSEFETIGAFRTAGYNVESEGAVVEPVAGADVTASTFELLRVPPLRGRVLDRDDESIGAPEVVVLGYDLWQSRFAGDPEVVGRAIRIGGVPHSVVGVMPEGFLFPVRQQLWVPLRERAGADRRDGLPLAILGRLADGVSAEQAETRMTAVQARLAGDAGEAHAGLRPEVLSSSFLFFGFPRGGLRAQPELYLAQLVSLMLLGVACTNVGMLVFARTASRSVELAVRTALGASRLRIVVQIFTECLVLALLAAGVGLVVIDRIPVLLLGAAGIDDLLPYWVDTGVTAGAAARALALAVFSAALAGVVPALRLTGRSVQSNIQLARAGGGGGGFGRISGALIVADVAVAVMVVGFAVGVGGFALDVASGGDGVGIDADEFLAVQLRLPSTSEDGDTGASARSEFASRVSRTQQELVRRLRAEPGVRGVALGSTLPRMSHTIRVIDVEGGDPADESDQQGVLVASVDVEFFEQLDQPILSGRGFDSSDADPDAATAIVNTSFVENVLGGRNPLGRRIRLRRFGSTEQGPWYVIVGVVGHLGMHVLRPDQDDGVYLPAAPGEIHPVRMAIHVGDDPESFLPRLREILREADPVAAITDPRVLGDVYEGDWYIMVGVSLGSVVLVGILLALAASGLYAILSFTVSQRTREIGVRAALGARRHRIALTVVRRALVQIALGVLLGLPLAGRLFFETAGESEPAAAAWAVAGTFALGLSVMLLVALAACTAPTFRALRISPTEALREGE